MRHLKKVDDKLAALLILTKDKELKADLTRLFINESYKTEFYCDNSCLLRTILKDHILVCILDFTNTFKDNLKILPVITRMKQNIKIIIIPESSSEKDIREMSMDKRIHCFLQKPVNYDALLTAVHSAFEFHYQRISAIGY